MSKSNNPYTKRKKGSDKQKNTFNKYGNYTSKKVAEDEKENLQKQGFKDIWIVKSRIN